MSRDRAVWGNFLQNDAVLFSFCELKTERGGKKTCILKIAVGLGSRRSRSGNEGVERHYCSQMPPRVSLAFDAKPRHQRYLALHTHTHTHMWVNTAHFCFKLFIFGLALHVYHYHSTVYDAECPFWRCMNETWRDSNVFFGLAQRPAVSHEKCVYKSSLNFLRS